MVTPFFSSHQGLMLILNIIILQEDFESGKHQLVTVGVEDVKSVKRVRKLQVRKG